MDNGLYGIIRGDGILCFCDVCGGSTVSFVISVVIVVYVVCLNE